MPSAALVAALGLSFGLVLPAFTKHQAHCYVSKNNTNVCYVRVGHQTYAAAVTEATRPEHTVIHFTCGQAWSATGSTSRSDMALIVAAICHDNTPSTDESLAA